MRPWFIHLRSAMLWRWSLVLFLLGVAIVFAQPLIMWYYPPALNSAWQPEHFAIDSQSRPTGLLSREFGRERIVIGMSGRQRHELEASDSMVVLKPATATDFTMRELTSIRKGVEQQIRDGSTFSYTILERIGVPFPSHCSVFTVEGSKIDPSAPDETQALKAGVTASRGGLLISGRRKHGGMPDFSANILTYKPTLGLLANTAVLLIPWLLAIAMRIVSLRRRVRSGKCANCGYQLFHRDTADVRDYTKFSACPECGKAY